MCQRFSDLRYREILIQLLVEDFKGEQGDEADEQVRPDPVLVAHEHRPHLQVGLADAEAVLDFPAPGVDLDYLAGVVVESCGQRAEPVELCLMLYQLIVERGGSPTGARQADMRWMPSSVWGA